MEIKINKLTDASLLIGFFSVALCFFLQFAYCATTYFTESIGRRIITFVEIKVIFGDEKKPLYQFCSHFSLNSNLLKF
jgi:hypothetical protein